MPVGWRITKDHFATPAEPTREGIGSGNHLPDDKFIYEWQTFDDDGGLCYSGIATDETFAPLDFSAADVGATYIKFRRRGSNDPWAIL